MEAGGARELVIFPGALGDLICFAPALRQIAQGTAADNIDLMAKPELARFAVGRLGVARDYSIDRVEMAHLFVERGGESSAARTFFGEFTRIHSFFAAENETYRRNLLTISPNVSFYGFRPEYEGHMASAYLREIGFEGEREVALKIAEDDRRKAIEILKENGLKPETFLLILPGSGSPKKNWPADNYLGLVRTLPSGVQPVIVLGPAEEGSKRVFAESGLTFLESPELGMLAAMARLSRGFVGNDSGVSHLAAASGARGLVIFGPTDPARWRPLGQIGVIRKDPINRLTVASVRAELAALLGV
jgi:heptosyltransferase-3